MPTSTGLPKKGDRLKHVASGVLFEVVHREGNGILFTIIARRLDGEEDHSGHHPYGYPKDHIRLTEFAWMLQQKLFVVVTKP